MRKIFFMSTLCFLVLLCSCSKKIINDVPVSDMMEKIRESAALTDVKVQDLKTIESAEEYGFNLEDMEEGEVCYTKAEESADRVVLVKAKSEESVEKIERALNAKIIALTDAWKNDERESEKVKDHIMKTKGKYVVLIITESAKEIEKVFDELLE